ncbi:MAG: CaiB/BaiF CoA-transferase family protein [Thermodesulfobacteriota bacterium]
MPGALDGLRVLDLSRLLPGPFATQVLADFGAEVVKVEEPGRGDYLREFAPLRKGESLFFLNLNRNKRSLALDLKKPEGREVFLRLAAGADVVVESFRPGVMDKLGVGYEVLRRGNPRLVYCAVTGYGQDGPLSRQAGHDVNYLGIAGALGLVRDAGGRPVVPGFQIADVGGGALTACLGILLALLARERTGRGQLVDAAMVDGVAPWLVYRWAFRGEEGNSPGPCLSGEYPCYGVYEAADGKWLAVGALEPVFWERLCRHLGRPEWAPLQFAQGEARLGVLEELQRVFRTRSRDAWAAELAPVDCCVTPVLEMDELEDHPYWAARKLVERLLVPGVGEVSALAAPVRLGETPAALRTAPPRLGQHTGELLSEAGYSEEEQGRLRASGAVG